jgi:hypothetical protein
MDYDVAPIRGLLHVALHAVRAGAESARKRKKRVLREAGAVSAVTDDQGRLVAG